MGITFAKLFQRLFSKKEMRILMVRDVLRSRDGFGREERAVYGFGRFFFSIFFFFPRKNQGRRHFAFWIAVERETGYLPPRARAGCDAFTRAESVRLYAFISLECIDRSSGFGGEKKTFKPNNNSVRLRGRAAKILVHFYDTSKSFFSREREFCSRLLTKILCIHIRKLNRLVSMPPVKPPSYTNLSSGKSWRRFRRSVRFRFSFASRGVFGGRSEARDFFFLISKRARGRSFLEKNTLVHSFFFPFLSFFSASFQISKTGFSFSPFILLFTSSLATK